MVVSFPMRSLIVTSALDTERIYNAAQFGADISLIDLEDAVPEAKKNQARQNLKSLDPAKLSGRVGLRINNILLRHGLEDLCALFELAIIPDILVIPKVENVRDVQIVSSLLDQAGVKCGLWALIESAAGLLETAAITRSSPDLVAVSFGMADYAADIGAEMNWQSMASARAHIVNCARAAGISAIDAPTFNIRDEQLLSLDAKRSKEMGFTGKVAVHPRQVPIINAQYSASQDEVLWAKTVVESFGTNSRSIHLINGGMIGPPFLRRAREILAGAGEV